MKYQGIFSERAAPSKLMLTLILILAGIFVFSLVGAGLIFVINPDIAMGVLGVSRDLSNPDTVNGLKLLQLMSSIGTFVFPAIFGAWLFSHNINQYLRLHRISRASIIFSSMLIMFFSLPVINLIGAWNNAIEFPESIKFIEDWMRNLEMTNQRLIEAFLTMDSFGDFLFNLVLIAVVPAIGEELLFRGVIQKEFNQWIRNHHIAIWLTAAIFSAIHMQFLGFIPRLLMGALFGYVLYWTGSLLLPILMHFINNATALTIVYFMELEMIPESTEDLGTAQDQWPLVALCVLVVGFMLFFIWKNKAQKKEAF